MQVELLLCIHECASQRWSASVAMVTFSYFSAGRSGHREQCVCSHPENTHIPVVYNAVWYLNIRNIGVFGKLAQCTFYFTSEVRKSESVW